MVSPSGTRGTGSTKVRAGRRQTLGCEPELVTWPHPHGQVLAEICLGQTHP